MKPTGRGPAEEGGGAVWGGAKQSAAGKSCQVWSQRAAAGRGTYFIYMYMYMYMYMYKI
jgi:hypothetical protein